MKTIKDFKAAMQVGSKWDMVIEIRHGFPINLGERTCDKVSKKMFTLKNDINAYLLHYPWPTDGELISVDERTIIIDKGWMKQTFTKVD